ncbi:hypothetical protein CRUP_017687 [Coryphaenoides rupestris]|nr:hypothetical protein CRUP_017687 [Coryphaenoides rupestris]
MRLVSPGLRSWLGESSSAYGGGAEGLSDAFVAGFMWLDKLGLAAKMGLDVVVRQVLIGSGTYHLVDDNLDPLPTTGTKGYSRGAVTLFALNLGAQPASLTLPGQRSLGTVEAFVLRADQPGKEGLYSRSVTLNERPLRMIDDRTLPELKGNALPPADRLALPGFSLAFYVFAEARAAACQ